VRRQLNGHGYGYGTCAFDYEYTRPLSSFVCLCVSICEHTHLNQVHRVKLDYFYGYVRGYGLFCFYLCLYSMVILLILYPCNIIVQYEINTANDKNVAVQEIVPVHLLPGSLQTCMHMCAYDVRHVYHVVHVYTSCSDSQVRNDKITK
jgi:hypothetical protein